MLNAMQLTWQNDLPIAISHKNRLDGPLNVKKVNQYLTLESKKYIKHSDRKHIFNKRADLVMPRVMQVIPCSRA